jgi:hypothetical protein
LKGSLPLRILAWALLTSVLLAWVALAAFTLQHALGLPAALAIVALAALLRLAWPLQLAVMLGAWLLWHWPWPLALLLAAPRLLLILPGLIAWWLARHRHPPAVWAPYRGQPSP